MTRSGIHLLSESEHAQIDIAERLDVSERSVRRVLMEPRPTADEVREEHRPAAPKLGRPSKVDHGRSSAR